MKIQSGILQTGIATVIAHRHSSGGEVQIADGYNGSTRMQLPDEYTVTLRVNDCIQSYSSYRLYESTQEGAQIPVDYRYLEKLYYKTKNHVQSVAEREPAGCEIFPRGRDLDP
ncbi:MAG: hypothetical protein U0Q18_35980 [Bryobacteraceae bacterium]